MPRCQPSSGHLESTVLSQGDATSTVKPVGGIGSGAPAALASGSAGRRSARPVARSKAAMTASQLVRLSSGSTCRPPRQGLSSAPTPTAGRSAS